MKTTVTQEFDAPIDQVLAARSAKLYNKVNHPDIKHVDYLSMEEKGDQIITKRTMHLSIPPAMQKLIKPEMAECVEQTTWDSKTGEAKFDILPKQMGKMLTWSGFVKYEKSPKDPNKTLRTCMTEATCNVPFMGKDIEKSIVKGYEKAMEKEKVSMEKLIGMVQSGELK